MTPAEPQRGLARALTIFACVIGIVGCDAPPTASEPIEGVVLSIDPDFRLVQRAGDTVTVPVLVSDSLGEAKDGVEVSWSVTTGGGAVLSSTDRTDMAGWARVQWVLGAGAPVEEQALEARVQTRSGEHTVAVVVTTSERWYETIVLRVCPPKAGTSPNRCSGGALNNLGGVLMWEYSSKLEAQSFLRTPDGTVTTLPFHGVGHGQINDLGQILVVPSDGPGVVCAAGICRDFGESLPYALNDAGDVLLRPREGGLPVFAEGPWFIDRGGVRTQVDVSPSLSERYEYPERIMWSPILTLDDRMAGKVFWDGECFIFDPSSDDVAPLADQCAVADLDPDGRFALLVPLPPGYFRGTGWSLRDNGQPVSFGGIGRRVVKPDFEVGVLYASRVARGGLSVGHATMNGPGRYGVGSFAWLVAPPYEYQLDQIIDDPAWILTEGLDVNDQGQVLALGINRVTLEEAFLLLDPLR